MAKRTATRELNHDNWDEDDEPESPGTFQSLSEEELKNRVIKKARRTFHKESSSGPSPFSSFTGFSSGTSNNPFDFLKKKIIDNEKSPFATSNNKEKKENGNSTENEKKESGDSENTNSQTPNFSASDKQKPTRSIEYYRQLQSLNECVMKWMQLHLSKNSCCDFTPVFNDYKKHLDTLNVAYPVKSKENAAVRNEDKSKPLQKSAANSSPFFKKNNDVNQEVKQKSNDDETDYGAHFSSNTTNTSTFSFGLKRTPSATSSISSGPTTSLRDDSEAAEKKPFQFSVGFQSSQSGFSKPFSFASAPTEKTEDTETAAEEAEYVPPKNDFVAVKEEDAIYSKRCKLFYKKDDNYVDRGVGVLHLKPLDGKTQLLIRADTSLGNILLNIRLSDTLPISRTGKNNVLLMCVPHPPIDTKNADSKPIPMLIRVKTSEDADELLETLNKYKS